MRKLQYIFGNVGIMFKVIILNSIATLFISLTLAFISIQYAQTQIKEQHEETFSRQLNDIFGLIHYIEERVKIKK